MSATHGAVAGGSRQTVDAGIRALESGGNAVDAAVAAQLTAFAAEPLLTGLGGGGIGMVRMNGRVFAWDFFSDMPGRAMSEHTRAKTGTPACRCPDWSIYPMKKVRLDYGPTFQYFKGGAASVAVPGMPRGLWELHQAHGTIPMARLAEPAIEVARRGFPVNQMFRNSAELLWAMLATSPGALALFGRNGAPKKPGEILKNPTLGRTIAAYVQQGPRYMESGEGAQALLAALGPRTYLCAEDLQAWRPRRLEPTRCEYRGASVWLPGLPSVGSCLVNGALARLQAGGPLPPLRSSGMVFRLVDAMRQTEDLAAYSQLDMSDPTLARRFVAACQAGFTTHISTIDQHGNAVGLTSSLGETAGILVPELGMMLNNFLGEDDVNPPDGHICTGQRLFTMTCPTLLERDHELVCMGSGGSSRIRTAVLHGIVHLLDYHLDLEQAVTRPRAHFEDDKLQVECWDRAPNVLEELETALGPVVCSGAPQFYFGGLHAVARHPGGFTGAGDPRRSGVFRKI